MNNTEMNTKYNSNRNADTKIDMLATDEARLIYDRHAGTYDICSLPMELMAGTARRQELFQGLKPGDSVIEIGVGTGRNIPHYPDNIQVTAIDFSERMLDNAKRRAEKLNVENVDFHLADVQELPFENNSFDRAVTTFVFCSVPDPLKGLSEVNRVLKPGARFDLLDNMTYRMMGAHINRKTMDNIRLSGFHVEREDNLFLDVVKRISTVPVCSKYT